MGVLENAKPIEVMLAGDPTSIPGIVTHMNGQNISIKLLEVSDRTERLLPGTPVEIAMQLKGVSYRATASVASCLVDSLVLGIVKHSHERAESLEVSPYPRRPCELLVRFRPVRADGCVGAWRHGMTVDVSGEGMTLLIDSQGGVPPRMKVTFSLDEKAGKVGGRSYTDDGTELVHKEDCHEIKATAQLVRSFAEPDGMIRAEFKFVAITHQEQNYLLDFAGRPVQ